MGVEPVTRRARVQARTVRMREQFVLVKHGEPARKKWLAAASPALTAVVAAGDKNSEWVDFQLFVEATELVDKLFGRGDLALAWEVGRFSATHELGVWKSLVMRHVRPSMLVGVAAGMWSHHYDTGRLISRPLGATSLMVGIEGFPTPHRAHCHSIAGWMHGSMELGPRRGIDVREVACRAHGGRTCEFHVGWTE